ncbi:MAG: fatty acid desaturase [Gammaproteobacteria bacterium]
MILFSATPALAITLVPLYGYFYGYELFEWLFFIFMMGFCGMSITAGYHRMWSHKTFTAHPIIRFVFALGGACSLQNDVLHWASDHRRHHQHVDNNDRDPYSAKRGFWFSHIGWILRNYESAKEDFSNVKDLQKDPIVRWQYKYYLPLVLLTNIGIPAIIGLLYGDVIASLLLAGLLRLVLSQHVTWLINSIAHMWGSQPYSTQCTARDNPLLALFTYGEGYHNFHHTFQWDYRNGVKWWHFDPTKWMISSLSLVGLTANLKRCPAARIEKTKLELQYQSVTSRIEQLNIPEKLRLRIEHEYEALLQTIHLWAEHRQAWYEAKGIQIQEKLEYLEHLQIRDKYREIQFKFRTQRRRWRQLINSLSEPLPIPA